MTYDEIDRKEWGRLVRESATGTWFQTPEAFDFFNEQKDLFQPFVIAIEKSESRVKSQESRELRGVCVGYVTKEKSAVKQFFTRRAIIMGGPALADDADSEEVETLMRAVRKQPFLNPSLKGRTLNSPIYIETRNFNDYSRWREAFERAGFAYKKHLNFHVDCSDKEAMWERLSENRKRQIRKQPTSSSSLKGREITNGGVTEEEIREWYGILERLYRTKVRTPLWPVEFFEQAYRQGVGTFLLVKHNNHVIGGSMVVEWKPTSDSSLNKIKATAAKLPSLQGGAGGRPGVLYEWFECGLNAKYKEQYPSVMATWAGMQYAAEHGCTRYDMMGAGEPGVPYGVRDFKSEFGGSLVEHGRWLAITKPLLYRIGVLGVKFLKRHK